MPMGFRGAIDVSVLFCANAVSCGALCSDRKANITQRWGNRHFGFVCAAASRFEPGVTPCAKLCKGKPEQCEVRGKTKKQKRALEYPDVANGKRQVSLRLRRSKHARVHKWSGLTILRSVEFQLRANHKSAFRKGQKDQNDVGVHECVIKASIRCFLHSLYSKPLPEHDVVPEGSVDVQVYLFYLCWEGASLLLHFLEDKEKVMAWKHQKQLSRILNGIASSRPTSYFPSLSCLTFSMSSSKAQAWPLSCRGMPLYTRFTNWTHMWKNHKKTPFKTKAL